MVKTSAQETTTTWESTVSLIRDAEDWAALAKREARERVSNMEAESAVALAYASEEAEGIVRRVSILEGELAEAHWDRGMAKENSRGLSDVAANAEWRREESERESWE